MKVEIWSDVVCPWCYIGKRRFEAALDRFPHRDEVEVVWRGFELDPGAGSARHGDRPAPADYADRLAAKYGTDREGAARMIGTMTEAGAREGLDLRFDRAVSANTFAAHQLILAARGHGLQDAVVERLLRAYFTEGEAVGDPDVLVRLSAEAGLDTEVARSVVDDGPHAAQVRAEQQEAGALGIRGVPFFVVDRRYGVSGAQPADVLLEVLERGWSQRRPMAVVGGGTAAEDLACGPDGCVG